LITVNGGIDLLSIIQIKKHTWSHFTLPKYPPKHHPSLSSTIFIINTIKVQLLILFSPYSISTTALHSHFDTHLICPNKCFPIFNSKVGMMFGKLEPPLLIKFLEKRSASGYLLIIAKVLEGVFEGGDANIKFKALYNRHEG